MTRRITSLFIATMVLALPLGMAQIASPQSRPASAPSSKRVLIISVDGLRPDMALRADMPTVRELMKHSAFTFWARTTAIAITLPSHTSMLTGVTPGRHGIMWNTELPLKEPIYPAFPTIFQVAKQAGFTTAMAAGKAKFATLAKPGTVDWCFTEPASDVVVTDKALAMMREHEPQVLFVHLPGVDAVGHASGWGSPEQIKAIVNADAQIRRILEELEDQHLRDQTLVIVTADHGGAGTSHGADDPRSRHIPWIVSGPGVREDFDLTLLPKLTVNTEDTFATACWYLGIPLAGDLDGRSVTEIMQPAPATK